MIPESNLISVREAEAAQPPVCLGAAGAPSGIDWILSGKARTKSLRAANSSDESPFTCQYVVSSIQQQLSKVNNFDHIVAN